MNKKTLILGASSNPDRISYTAAHRLKAAGHSIVNVGIKEGEVAGEKIYTNKPIIEGVDTITLYIGVKNQAEWYDYILKIKPLRIVFNPNTENPELEALASAQGIAVEEACTLVLLSTGQY